MHRDLLTVSALAAFLLPLPAQSVSVTTEAWTPIQVAVTVAGQGTSSTQPIGPLATQGSVFATQGPTGAHAEGSVRWSTEVDPSSTKVWLSNVLVGDPGVASAVSVPAHSFVVSFVASNAGVPCDLELFHFNDYTPGATLPRVDIDFGNDGAIDLPGLQLGTTIHPFVTLSTQPTVVRIVMNAQLNGAGWSLTTFSIAARPRNAVAMTQLATGCTPGYGELLPPVPVFADRGIDLIAVPGEDAGWNVYVIGLSQQPQLLPPQAGPCLLLPSPDILIAQWAGLHIALPAIVRPVTFYVQGFEIGTPAYPGQGLYGVTRAYGITAF